MNLTVKTMVTACVVATAATLGLAAPAQANPSLLNGTYDIDGGDQDAYWTASSTCATDGCVARIVSNVGWSGNAVMNNGRWNLTVTKPDVAEFFNALVPIQDHMAQDLNITDAFALVKANR